MKSVSRTMFLRIFFLGAVLVSAALILGKPTLHWAQAAVNIGPTGGHATSWSTQLSTALEAASREIKDPVLVAAHVQTIGEPPKRLVDEQAFEVEFLFGTTTSTQTLLCIDLNDVEPTQTVRKNTADGFFPVFSIRPSLAEYVRLLETVKLSPRDVYNLTLQDASATLGDSDPGYLVKMYLHLVPEFEGIPENEAVWSIYYSRPGGDQGKGWRVDYLVNAETGSIVRRVEDRNVPTMSPSRALPQEGCSGSIAS